MSRIACVALAVWLLVATIVGGLLMVSHTPLPTPAAGDSQLRAAITSVLPAASRWGAVHVMYRSCPCSQKTITHLIAGDRPRDLDETVVIVDDSGQSAPDDARLRAAGFRTVVVTPDELATRFALEAAPVLVVARPDRSLAYVGGYQRHKQRGRFEDAHIVDELRRDESPASLAVFGCATSDALARTRDPLGLRR